MPEQKSNLGTVIVLAALLGFGLVVGVRGHRDTEWRQQTEAATYDPLMRQRIQWVEMENQNLQAARGKFGGLTMSVEGNSATTIVLRGDNLMAAGMIVDEILTGNGFGFEARRLGFRRIVHENYLHERSPYDIR